MYSISSFIYSNAIHAIYGLGTTYYTSPSGNVEGIFPPSEYVNIYDFFLGAQKRFGIVCGAYDAHGHLYFISDEDTIYQNNDNRIIRMNDSSPGMCGMCLQDITFFSHFKTYQLFVALIVV
jgi:hypothetical protein